MKSVGLRPYSVSDLLCILCSGLLRFERSIVYYTFFLLAYESPDVVTLPIINSPKKSLRLLFGFLSESCEDGLFFLFNLFQVYIEVFGKKPLDPV